MPRPLQRKRAAAALSQAGRAGAGPMSQYATSQMYATDVRRRQTGGDNKGNYTVLKIEIIS